MMERPYVICLDHEVLRFPESIGLDGERLEHQPWLAVVTDADEARALARRRPSGECWVVGSDTVDGINLAATMKRDGAERVSLVSFYGGGSVLSRAAAAGINEVMGRQTFVRRYAEAKHAYEMQLARMQATGPLVPVALPQTALPAAAAHGESPKATVSSVAIPHEGGVAAVVVGASAAPGAGLPLAAGDDSSLPAPLPTDSAVPAGAAPAAPVVTPVSFVAPAPAVAPTLAAAPTAPPERAPAHAKPVSMPVVDTGQKGYVLTVVSAAGGSGKSTVAVLFGMLAQMMGLKTVVVDADLQCGDLHYLLGDEQAVRIDSVIDNPARIESLEPQRRMPALVASPQNLEYSEETSEAVPRLIESLRSRFDCVVVNTAPAWDDLHMELIELSSNVLFVLDQRPTAVRACRHVLELCSRCGVATQSFVFAVNRVARGALFTSIDVSCALACGKTFELAEGGKDVEELMGTGQPSALVDMRNPLAVSVGKVASELLPNAQAVPFAQPKKRKIIGSRGKKAACL